MLFNGQAQKEFVYNEAQGLIDCLLHCTVQGIADSPPTSPTVGENWLIGDQPTGLWEGRAGEIATMVDGGWRYISAQPGMSVYIQQEQAQVFFKNGSWLSITSPPPASGGTVIDSQVRQIVQQLVQALQQAGLFK